MNFTPIFYHHCVICIKITYFLVNINFVSIFHASINHRSILETINWAMILISSRYAVYTKVVIVPRCFSRIITLFAVSRLKWLKVERSQSAIETAAWRTGIIIWGCLTSKISHAISMPEWIRAQYRDEKAGIRKGQTPRKLVQREWKRKKRARTSEKENCYSSAKNDFKPEVFYLR